jgi:putative redox protein
VTVRLFAKRKEMPLERVIVSLSHSKIYAKDCMECEDKTGKVDQILCKVELVGKDLTETQRKTLMEIAEMCPVHRTITSKPRIKVSPA